MDATTPHHACLPVWKDKNAAQKRSTLAHMISDLMMYAPHLKTLSSAAEQCSCLEARRIALLCGYERAFERERAELLEDLDGMVDPYGSDAQEIEEVRRLLIAHPDFLTVGCEVGHVTGSALVVDVSNGTLLLHRHRNLNIWLQFGGHPDFELNMLDVAMRESKEESGIQELRLLTHYKRVRIPIDVELQRIPANASRPAHLHADFRYVLAASGLVPAPAGGESRDFRVMKFADALSAQNISIGPSVRRLIAKAKALVASERQRLFEMSAQVSNAFAERKSCLESDAADPAVLTPNTTSPLEDPEDPHR